MAKQIKRMNLGGSTTGFNAKTGSNVNASSAGRRSSGVDNSNTNTTQGERLKMQKKGGTIKRR